MGSHFPADVVFSTTGWTDEGAEGTAVMFDIFDFPCERKKWMRE